MKRKIYSELVDWKNRTHKPLLVCGQKQVGKTYIITEFGKNNYENFICIDFSINKTLKKFFRITDLDVDSIVRGLRIYIPNAHIEPGKTLFFFDEVQECLEARQSMKQFAMDGRYDVIASGSMLGVVDMLGKKNALPPLTPLGYVEIKFLQPMDFEEFLWAIGHGMDETDGIRNNVKKRIPFGQPVCKLYLDAFREYQIVGGMPESVQAFAKDTSTFTNSYKVQRSILNICISDISRYCPSNEVVKTAKCFESIPAQLAESNKRFMYTRVDPEKKTGSRDSARNLEYGLHWIKLAGYANFCYGLNQIALPLMNNENLDLFKVYLSDTGLLASCYGPDAVRSLFERDNSYNFGALAENTVCECLVKNGYRPRFYRKNNGQGRMEIDFVIENADGITAIEVKSGKTRDMPSLWKLPQYFKVDRRILLAEEDVSVDDDGIEHLPLFAAAFFEPNDEFDWPWRMDPDRLRHR